METFLTAYYTLRDAKAELVLASPEGGYPLGLSRGDREDPAPVLQRFRVDRMAREEVADMLGIDQVVASDFDAAFCIGAVGAREHNEAALLIATLLGCGKPVVMMADAVEVAAHAVGNGMLIVAGAAGSPEAAARALLEAARAVRDS